MSCNTDLIICLWLVPIVAFLLLPLVLTALALPLLKARHALFSAGVVKEEKRKQPRLSAIEGAVAQVTVGDTTVTGLVSNFSQAGICLKNLPESFSYKINKMSVIVQQYGIDYKLLVKAKWTELTDSGKKFGAEIDTASPEWSHLLLQTAKA